jgi:hypothetical protein
MTDHKVMDSRSLEEKHREDEDEERGPEDYHTVMSASPKEARRVLWKLDLMCVSPSPK